MLEIKSTITHLSFLVYGFLINFFGGNKSNIIRVIPFSEVTNDFLRGCRDDDIRFFGKLYIIIF